jgi:hypothetical protein
MADVCIVCCDRLTGLPDAIGVVWPQATVQLCVVHLIRASLRYASRRYWVPLAKDLRPVYTAVDESAAAAALETSAPGVNDLLRRPDSDPVTDATITYTDGRTLPSGLVPLVVAGGRMARSLQPEARC